ncbi:general amino acid permease [Spathaspora passalidarum NRRL Y-27907]|uniref:General amino acid permease n=1 Tax=Spathaspora passalidarum (strain NRRL Y-27907 / 11-Y1) TaxID=619300 RepID=G3AQJ3_SPAPN|nr:general amino acid permease [Spathaspora passalidarum NRRL Y-27907]EGW31540.1 general amino acid permease [Spathaspora passalidarum NRRL Y-27907]
MRPDNDIHVVESPINDPHIFPTDSGGSTGASGYSNASDLESAVSSSDSSSGRFNPRYIAQDFIDSFKPFDFTILPPVYFKKPEQQTDTSSSDEPKLHPNHPQFDYSHLTDLERDALVTSTSPLSKHLKTRHLTLISLGAVIGTGLFISSANALAHAGPLGNVLVWIYIGSIVFTTMSSLAELATAFPVSGAFVTYTTLFIDSSFGFAIAWNYALQWLTTMPLQLIAASLTIKFWTDSINPAVFITIFYVVIVLINLFGVKGYGEAESFLSVMKILAVVGFNILAIVIVTGGVPGQPYIGAKNWHPPEGGLFNDRQPFKQMCYIISNASFAYAGSEIFALASVESATPRKSINRARLQIFYRVMLFYIFSMVMIGFLIPYTSPKLLGSGSKAAIYNADANASPFVIAVKNAGIKALPSIMNVVIIITVLSVGNASVYGSSRVMCALGSLRQGPRWLSYIDRKGRPMAALLVQFAFGLLAYLVCIPGTNATFQVFEWMLSLSGLCVLFTYFAICVSHLRFRRALSVRARVASEELVFTGPIWCSWYAIISIIIVLVLQFWAALWPPPTPGSPYNPSADPQNLFKIYLGGVVLLIFWFGHKIYNYKVKHIPLTKLWLSAKEIDVDTGRRVVDLEQVKQQIAEEKLSLQNKPWWYKVMGFFC